MRQKESQKRIKVCPSIVNNSEFSAILRVRHDDAHRLFHLQFVRFLQILSNRSALIVAETATVFVRIIFLQPAKCNRLLRLSIGSYFNSSFLL